MKYDQTEPRTATFKIVAPEPQPPQEVKFVIKAPEPQPPQEISFKFVKAPSREPEKFTFKKEATPQPPEPERMTRRDFLQTWGFLQTLKDELEAKARAAASGGAELGPQVAGDYLKMCAEISAMQEKIDREAAARE